MSTSIQGLSTPVSGSLPEIFTPIFAVSRVAGWTARVRSIWKEAGYFARARFTPVLWVSAIREATLSPRPFKTPEIRGVAPQHLDLVRPLPAPPRVLLRVDDHPVKNDVEDVPLRLEAERRPAIGPDAGQASQACRRRSQSARSSPIAAPRFPVASASWSRRCICSFRASRYSPSRRSPST